MVVQRSQRRDAPAAALLIAFILCIAFTTIYLNVAMEEVSWATTVGRFNLHHARMRFVRSKAETPNIETVNATESRRTIVLIANYRDSIRCAETLNSLFTRADHPELLDISLVDQIYEHLNETRCFDLYCMNVGEAACRRGQLRYNETIHADNATGPTLARYCTEKGIDLTTDAFALAIDSHLVFVPHWDTELKAQWDSIGNPNAVMTGYPRSTMNMPSEDWSQLKLRNTTQLMCTAFIETKDADAMIQYGGTTPVAKPLTPQLMSQFAGGFNFGSAKQALEVRNDPYTPYLFHGEEYSKAARLFTHGYDMYAPSQDIAFHWFEKRNVIWEKNWSARYVIQQRSKRRIRRVLGLPTTSDDYDATDIHLFSLGTKRTFKQFQNFSGIDPLAAYAGTKGNQFNNCRLLDFVPIDDGSVDLGH